MSCPEWATLEVSLWRPDFDETTARRDAVAHLRGCADCRRRALALDPTLVFAGCREIAVDPTEVAALRRATRDLRRVRSLERAARRVDPRRAATTAGLVLAAVLLLPAVPADPILEAPPTAAVPPVAEVASPWIDNLDRPTARIYQWGSPEVAVVLVVDESLDV